MKKGDLLHIPQASRCRKLECNDNIISEEIMCEKPQVALFVSEHFSGAYKVFMNGQYWHVDKTSVYPLRVLKERRKYGGQASRSI
tara:strand:+ start:302 stop:556 length:255 start_codon:yes stop_codon:yes gene_type:complete